MSSLKGGEKGEIMKNSSMRSDGLKKINGPTATSTPIPRKGSGPAVTPALQSSGSRTKALSPRCSPVTGKPTTHTNKKVDGTSRLNRDDKPKGSDQSKVASLRPVQDNKKRSEQPEKLSKSTESKSHNKVSGRKTTTGQPKVSSAQPVRNASNLSTKANVEVEKNTPDTKPVRNSSNLSTKANMGIEKDTPDTKPVRKSPYLSTIANMGVEKDTPDTKVMTSKRISVTPSIVVEDVDSDRKCSKELSPVLSEGDDECDIKASRKNGQEPSPAQIKHSAKSPPVSSALSIVSTADGTSGSSDSSKTLSPSDVSKNLSIDADRAASPDVKPTPNVVNRPVSPGIPVRRRLSYTPTAKEYASMSFSGRRKSELTPIRGSLHFDVLKRGNNSVDSLKDLNQDLQDQVAKLRGQMDNQRGSIRQTHWQKVVELRQIREQEQQRLNVALADQLQKLEKEKQRELEQLRGQLSQKFESELQKLNRFKDAEISKLKLEVSSKDAMLHRLLGESRHARMKLDIDDRKMRLMDELKDLRQAKRELKSSLDNANFAERAFSNNMRRYSESFESELARVKKEAQVERKQLIEQLKNKDKLISQLEKDLGRQSVGGAAHFAVLERRRSEGNPLPPGGFDPSPQQQPFRALPDGSDHPDAFHWTPTSIQTPGDVEDEWTNSMMEGNKLGKMDLSSMPKGTKDRQKGLLEKCRSYLQQNKELSAQNRAFKESSDRASQDTKNAHEILEHSKLQLMQLSRQLSQLKAEKSDWELQMREVEGLRQELVEDKKMINALRKACSDKDRRIDLIQHRKKRRRMIESAEKAKFQSAGLKETPFGYEEDDQQQHNNNMDGNQSVCSLSSTISDDSVWEDVLSKEETERNYQRLMVEQLELQKSHALLQRQTDSLQDPQREHLSKADLQNDLFLAQCRIEQLEYYIREGLQGRSDDLSEEMNRMQAQNKTLNTMVKSLEKENTRLQNALANAQELSEDMEFRLIELEQCREREAPCPDTDPNPSTSTSDQGTEECSRPSPPQADSASVIVEEPPAHVREATRIMEQLAKQLNALLKDKGKDAESALKKFHDLIEKEKAVEGMAHELQMKVISLQQEKNSLQDKLLLVEQSMPGKGVHSASLTQAKERQENLALKAAIESQSRLVTERINLKEELEDLKVQNAGLKQRVESLTHQQHPPDLAQEDVIQPCIQPNLLAQVPNDQGREKSSATNSTLSRKSSGRKSKLRDETDPITSKRRKSSPESESDDGVEAHFRSCQSIGNSQAMNRGVSQDAISNEETETMTDTQEENADDRFKINRLEKELSNINNCNDDLRMQLQQSIAKKKELESSHQALQDNLSSMEQGFDLLHQENVALGDQLRQRVEEFQLTQDERNPRVSELEEFCEDLQDRLKEAENSERILREKLKMSEKTMEEAEIHEMAMRERCEQLLTGDYEAKKQIKDLQRTGLELRDIVLEKEMVEQALRDKVEFLHKAEEASVRIIDELEETVKELRQRLDEKSNGKAPHEKYAHQITEMKHQMTFLETDNKALSSRVSELEENEEILRENWRRVAEEDFNRTQCLEEKVKMLEGLNRELKVKLKDAQEYLVVDMSNVSLAAELEESESRLFDDSSDDNSDGAGDADEVDSPGKDSGEKKVMREKVRKLERQLSEIAEKKNSKIESLQDDLVDLRETEIKLSETISEMEMTERELRAKLALYESSEVTVEKMLKYQSKIEELRTSQESLLDQLEIKENEGMTLHEKMQEMERTLRGKIVTLEVEMKGYKQKELRNAGHIRELEKKDTELSDKVAQQAEKENGLYVKISSLMDELKTCKTELDAVRKQMEDKEDKVRQAKLLEVKLLEIEMECGKKVSTLNAKLRHREEEFRQKENAYEEQISSLQDGHQDRSTLEEEFAQKEQHIREKDEEISILSTQISNVQKSCDEAKSKVCSLENELESEKMKVSEKESLINSLQEEIESKVQNLECVVIEKEAEHEAKKESLESEIRVKEQRVSELEEEVREAQQQLMQFQHDENSKEQAMRDVISDLKSFNDNSISRVEQKVASKLTFLENKLETMQHRVSDLQVYISEQSIRIFEVEADKEEQRKMYEEAIQDIEKEKDTLEGELTNQISVLNSQLEEESEQAHLLKESQEREASLRFDVSHLQHQVEQHKHDLISKLSDLEAKNKAHCELSLDLSNVRHEHKILQKELEKSNQSCTDMALSLKSVISQKDQQLNQSSDNVVQLNKVIEELEKNVDQKEKIIDQISLAKDTVIEKSCEDNTSLLEEKLHLENELTEKCQELDKATKLQLEAEKELVEIRKMLLDKDDAIQKHEQEKSEKEMKLKETESHVQNVQVDRESVAQELQSVKTVLEGAQNQITRQQKELQLLHTQLQGHQEDNKQFQQTVKENEEKLQEKDQMYQQKLTELKKINQQLQDRDQKLEQADSKVADVEMKLQKAENRVRELESMQVSLEMRLEERYAVSQNAEKVLRSKEMQCSEMDNKLEVAEKNLVNLKDQLSVGDESNKELVHRLDMKVNELDLKESEVTQLKKNLEEKEALNLSLESKFRQLEINVGSIETGHDEEKERLENIISERDTLISSIETRLQKSDSDLKELKSELDSAKQTMEEKENCLSESEFQLASLQDTYSDLKLQCENLDLNARSVTEQVDQKKIDLDKLQKQTEEKDSQLNQCKIQLSKTSHELADLLIKLEEAEKVLSTKNAEIEQLNEDNVSLRQHVDKVSTESSSVLAREERLHQEIQNKEEEKNILISKLESEKLDLASTNESFRKENSDLLERIESTQQDLSKMNKQSLDITESKESLSKQLSQIQSSNESLLSRIDTLESDLSMSKSERDEAVQEARKMNKQSLDVTESKESLSKQLSQIQSSNESLQSRIDILESDLSMSKSERDEAVQEARKMKKQSLDVTESKESLSKQLSQIQSSNESLQSTINTLESDLSMSKSERDEAVQEARLLKEENDQLGADNVQLQKEIEEADKEFQSLTISFEESKTNIEKKVDEISLGKQKVEENFEALHKEHTDKTCEMTKLMKGKNKELEGLKHECTQLNQERTELVANIESLKNKLSLKEANDEAKLHKTKGIVEDEIVCESMIKVNMAPTLHSQRPESNAQDDRLEAVNKQERENEQHVHVLEASLNQLKETEKHLQKRVSELETVEKELREQIVDIEMTVIVPLENETQDLKDELGMVKQERDEAISKISKWDDDDDNSEGRIQESETVHQRLEESLMYGEELEKKNEILLNDIQKLENESEKLHVKIADLEASESERKDEIDSLREEIDDLHENHNDSAVLEETETTLMDKVLDLEERERNLIQEVENLKKTVSDSEKDWSATEGMNEKLKYFEQKIQILEDAEGRYMDKIMELEEDKHRLLSKMSSTTDNDNSQMSQSQHIPHTSVNKITVSISTQTSVPLETSNTAMGATQPSDGVNTLSSSGQTSTSSSAEESVQNLSVLEDQLRESREKLEELDARLREKETLVLYLQDKLELLQESEGKLMDKLLEAEENVSSIVHASYAAQISELNSKIEQVSEENEFLAENVEQYKNSYKEEKKKCNDLQDRLMEDTVSAAELQKSQEELYKTQQMVEDIQSEYEEQLSERIQQENILKEEISLAVTKHNQLEQIVNAKAKMEEELQDQVDTLKKMEQELKAKLTLGKREDEDSALSDSGISADDPRVRHEHPPVVEEAIVHRTVKTVQLATPANTNNSASPSTQSPEPVPLPRYKRKLRQSSIEKISNEELVFLVEDLQEREAALKKRVSELQAIDESDLSQKVVDLENEKLQLERRLRYVEHQNTVSSKPATSGPDTYHSSSSGVLSTSTAMLEKPEDVLNQRIKELEGLDKHNKNTVSELERDRELLHEIARKDKATIHDLNVKIRELQLSERSLKEQVSSLEVSESSYFNKSEELEVLRVKLEDRVHELEIHERRLRELVRKLKLDEERWLSKSDGMDNAVAELSANESQLRRLVQDMEMEKGGLSERMEFMEARIRELESVKATLLARVKDYETNEVTLQSRLVQLENAEAAAHSKASELDAINVNLTQQHKKIVDENYVMNQHLAQLQGQVQDLYRRLLSSEDSEMAYKQHVESLQKNESLLQKKVREFELREIDSQSAIRELEQTAEINQDKLSALQRSENRLRYRVQELEGVGGQIPGELTPSQQQKVPQNTEDCQKRIVVLQSQVENLKLQLRQALDTTQQQSANKSVDEEEKSKSVSIATEEYSQLHVKAALLDEYAYQNEELETSREQLRDTILQLRQGKGACGHEVEIEVYKRRLESLQTFISKLKSSLSEGQTTSLLASELDSGPEGETLPARHLQVLESERVLQSVRGLHTNGKADDTATTNGGGHATGLAPVEDSMVQATSLQQNMMASPPSSSTPDNNDGGESSQKPRLEESHWKAIEARKPVTGDNHPDSRGGVGESQGRGGINVVTTSSPRHHGNKLASSTPELEEVTGVLNLHSESELSSYHRTNTHNESDSCSSPVPPPRKNRANRLSRNMSVSDDNSSVNNGSGSGSDRDNHHHHHHHHQQYSVYNHNTATANQNQNPNQKHFGDGINNKSLPLTASNIKRQLSSQSHQKQQLQQQQKQQRAAAPLSRFAEDSFYLPSSTQEGVDSLDDDESPPPLPSQGPPGQEAAILSDRSSRTSSTNMGMMMMMQDEGRRESLDNSASGLSIRDRIAMIERHLQSDTHTSSHGREEEDQLFYWKRKSTENLRQAEVLDKNNKFLKEDINRLEKELEEKRRSINTLELWLSSTEDLLKNKNKQTDREMVEQLQLDLNKLRRELSQSGYRSQDALLDAAALKTDLEHKDKDIASKRIEIESLAQELRKCHKECRSIEGMRRTALDSLRSLEKEFTEEKFLEEKLKKSQAEIKSLKAQYENKRMDLNTIISEKDELEYGMSRLIIERDSFKIDLQKTEKDRTALSQQVEDLKTSLDDLSRVEEKNVKLEEEMKSLNALLVQRNDKIREVYEENLTLRDSVNKSEAELARFRTLCDDFNNLSARYDELDQFKNQALALVQPLQMKVDALTKKCQEKDLLLRRLGAELRRGAHRPSSALDELTRLEQAMNGDGYLTDNSDNTSIDLSPRATTTTNHHNNHDHHTTRGRSVSMDDLSLYNGETNDSSNHKPAHASSGPLTHASPRRQRPTPYVNSRPRSAEAMGNLRSPGRGHQRDVGSNPNPNIRPSIHHRLRGFDLNQEQFVAIADYDPGLFSQSGCPKLELSLREGDQVRVTGPMDRLGYCEAECNGRLGLVPANYLQPVHYPDSVNSIHNHISPQHQHHQHHAPSVIHLDNDIAPPPPPQFQDNQHFSPNGQVNSRLAGDRPVPAPPSHLHIKGIEEGCIVLAWKPPAMDANGCNQGFQLKGYMVYVDNQEYHQTPTPQHCQTSIEGLDPSTPHHLSVQSVCTGGHVSPVTQMVFEGMLRLGKGGGGGGGSGDQMGNSVDVDLSSVLNSAQYTKGAKKEVMALYEYNPKQQSPHDYTAFELAFQPGDVISVYGEPRPDGFYHGKMDGKRGLVPACFVEDLASRHGKQGSQDSGHESSKA